MKPSRTAFLLGASTTPLDMRAISELCRRNRAGKSKTKIKALARAFMKYRAAKLAEAPSVDTFFNRGESAARFAHFE